MHYKLKKNTMKIRVKLSAMFLMAAVLMMLSAGSINAQENFSGKWAINQAKSNLGTPPAAGGGGGGQGQGMRGGMGASEFTATQQGNSLSVESTRQGRDGAATVTTVKYDLTGKVSENATGNNTSKSTAVWSADKKVLTITTTRTMNMQGESREIKTVESWKLTDGGKTLSIESTNATPNGEMKTTRVYDKK
jgi:Tol biopolymer transport system component